MVVYCCHLPSLLYRREALQKWKQKFGSKATYRNLISVFRRAGYEGYAEHVYKILGKLTDSVKIHYRQSVGEGLSMIEA